MKINALEFARRVGTSRSTILDYAKEGKIRGQKIGSAWHFEEEEANRYMQMYPSKARITHINRQMMIDDLFSFRISKEAVLACLAWDETKVVVVANSFLPQPANTVRMLAIGTLWDLYSIDIIKRIQGKD